MDKGTFRSDRDDVEAVTFTDYEANKARIVADLRKTLERCEALPADAVLGGGAILVHRDPVRIRPDEKYGIEVNFQMRPDWMSDAIHALRYGEARMQRVAESNRAERRRAARGEG